MAVAQEESNVERTYRAWDCFRRRDPDDFMEMCTPDVEFTTFVSEMEGRVYRGEGGVREWFTYVDETFDEFSPEVVDVTDLGDGVVAEVLIRGTVRGLALEQRAFQLVGTDDERQIRRWTWHRTRDDALAAAKEARVR